MKKSERKLEQRQLQEYQRLLEVDTDNLDSEVARLPSVFYTVCDKLAEVTERRDRARDTLNQVNAAVADELRTEAERRGDRVVERRIESEIQINEKYRRAREAYLAACADEQRWSALRDAFLQKSYMLRLTVELELQRFRQSDNMKMGNKEADAARAALTRRRKKR
jgi:hypothetical protein